MPTLYQIIKDKLQSKSQQAEEQKVYNPLDIRVGSLVTIDAIDFRGKQWKVAQIRAYDITPSGSSKHFRMTEYTFQTAPFPGAECETCFLRVYPKPDDPNRVNILLLTAIHDTPWDGDGEAIVGVCRNPSEDLDFREYNEEKGINDCYWRVDDNKSSFLAIVRVLEDQNGDGMIAADEIRTIGLEYWDFWRNFETEGVEILQYLYIELDSKTGWVQGKRGQQIEPERVFITSPV